MKKRYIFFTELFIWILVLFCSFYFFVYNTSVKENAKNTYYIFVDDAGGLVRGSPVKLMGITAGYVRDVKIFDNKVFVSFLITRENTVLPKEVLATIEFYGLGGSTSLELSPKDLISDDKRVIIPSDSYRVQDFWDGQKLVSEVMIDIYGSIGRNIDKSGILNHKEYLKQSNLIKGIAVGTDNFNRQQEVIIEKLSKDTIKLLKNGNKNDNINSEGVVNE